MSWPGGKEHQFKTLVLWSTVVATLVSLSKTLNLCFVLRMGRRAVCIVFCSARKITQCTYWKEKGLAPVFLFNVMKTSGLLCSLFYLRRKLRIMLAPSLSFTCVARIHIFFFFFFFIVKLNLRYVFLALNNKHGKNLKKWFSSKILLEAYLLDRIPVTHCSLAGNLILVSIKL